MQNKRHAVDMLAQVICLLRSRFGAFPWTSLAAILAVCPSLGEPRFRAKTANLDAKIAFWGSVWDGFAFYDHTSCYEE